MDKKTISKFQDFLNCLKGIEGLYLHKPDPRTIRLAEKDAKVPYDVRMLKITKDGPTTAIFEIQHPELVIALEMRTPIPLATEIFRSAMKTFGQRTKITFFYQAEDGELLQGAEAVATYAQEKYSDVMQQLKHEAQEEDNLYRLPSKKPTRWN
jgi:hypothetical protein